MTTVKLKISEGVLDKVLWLLGHFSKDELEIVHEDPNFLANKKKITEELERMEKGEAKFVSLNEFDAQIRQALAKHGDKD